MTQVIWVEIPVKDIQRALKFYQTVFELGDIAINDDGERQTAILFYDEAMAKPGISLNQTANFEPSDKGLYVYLDCGEDLTPTLNRVEGAGGKIAVGKTSMGEAGRYASVIDTEGNLIGLWSPK